MKFKEIVTGISIQLGYKVPAYLGYSYREFERDTTVFHIVPLNFIIRFFKHLGWIWMKFTHKPSKIDRHIRQDQYIKAYNDYRKIFELLVELYIAENNVDSISS